MTKYIHPDDTLNIYYRVSEDTEELEDIVKIERNDDKKEISDIPDLQNTKIIQWSPDSEHEGEEFEFEIDGFGTQKIKVIKIPENIVENFDHLYILDSENTVTDSIGDGPELNVDGPTLVEDDNAPFGQYLDFDSDDKITSTEEISWDEVSTFVWHFLGTGSAEGMVGVSSTDPNNIGWGLRAPDHSWVLMDNGADSLEINAEDSSLWQMTAGTYKDGTSNIYAYDSNQFLGSDNRSADYGIPDTPTIKFGEVRGDDSYNGNVAVLGIVKDEIDKNTFDNIWNDTKPE